jgi:hypothetical protein
LLERRGMLRFPQVGQQAGVHAGMQGLDPAVEHLRKTSDLFHRGHRNSFIGNGFRGRSGRYDVDTGGVQAGGEFDKPGLVVHADQYAADRPSP